MKNLAFQCELFLYEDRKNKSV